MILRESEVICSIYWGGACKQEATVICTTPRLVIVPRIFLASFRIEPD